MKEFKNPEKFEDRPLTPKQELVSGVPARFWFFIIGILLAFNIGATAAVRYVSVVSATPASPFANWTSAALTIQDALDISADGDTIIVTNGVYQTGGRVIDGTLTNRVAITKAVLVQSVNGPESTVIRGCQLPGVLNGDSAVRCVYLTNGATLSGFTLSNGATRATGDLLLEQSGGGVLCMSMAAVVSNCVLAGNSASDYGGGAFCGTFNDCTFSANTAALGGGASSNILNRCVIQGNFANNGGGAFASALNYCTITNNFAFLGGGTHSSVLSDCTISANSASSFGGGAYSGTLSNCSLTANLGYYGGGAYSNVLIDCVLIGNSASYYGGGAYAGILNRCTLLSNSAASGGAAYLGVLNNCLVKSNSAANGGGAYLATLNGCEVAANSASSGGGVYSCTVNDCTITGNSASSSGGGAYSSTLRNSIAFYNRAPFLANWSTSALDYCCTTPLPQVGAGNIDAEPRLANSSHLSASSPCRAVGNAASGVDIDGESWVNPPSIGCDEFHSGGATGPVSVEIQTVYTNICVGFSLRLTAQIEGHVTASRWDYGDGTIVADRPYSSHAWLEPGDYSVVLWAYNDENPGGISTTSIIHVLTQPILYVSRLSSAPIAPYSSWATAAMNIQDAVDSATVAGALVLVTNGIYSEGGRSISGLLTNRVAVTKPLVLRSQNGPLATTIRGNQNPDTINGSNAVRCVYLADGAALVGFTLTNGATSIAGDSQLDQSGGGVWCASASAIVSNCVLVGNAAAFAGGGAYFGELNNCTLMKNQSPNGGGAYLSILSECVITTNTATQGGGVNAASLDRCSLIGNSASVYGGGAYSSTLNQCVLTANSATIGGGTYSGVANNCVMSGNVASASGGGAYGGVLNNCTLVTNAAASYAGGASFSTVNNTITYYNSSPIGPNYFAGTLDHCCASPLPDTGPDNFAFEPQFIDLASGNLHLQSDSPCINAGRNAHVAGERDLDGNPRIVNGTVDAGAYELQPAIRLQFVSWLQQHSLATDGSADFADPDGDGMNNWQEFLAGTDPTNNASTFRIINEAKDLSGFTVVWQSVTGRAYFIQRASGLDSQSSFVTISTNIIGQPTTTSFTDNTAPSLGHYFYRVGTGDNAQTNSGSAISYAWLHQYGLPTDGSADFADLDQDGMNNWQEWKAGTDPTNGNSLLRMLTPLPGTPAITIAWTSVTNRFYLLERATKLSTPDSFTLLQSNIAGSVGTTTYWDTNAANLDEAFYRVRVLE